MGAMSGEIGGIKDLFTATWVPFSLSPGGTMVVCLSRALIARRGVITNVVKVLCLDVYLGIFFSNFLAVSHRDFSFVGVDDTIDPSTGAASGA